MCRIAAFRGQEISLDDFLTAPKHNLYQQAWAAREMREATVNADGFGVGWFDGNDDACSYRSVAPVWSDANIESLGRSLKSRIWVGNVRSSTDGQDLGLANTQPFRTDELLFVHNGYVKDFTVNARRLLRNSMTAETESRLRGTTDSEYLFVLLSQFVGSGESLPTAMRHLRGLIAEQLPETECLLTAIAATPHSLCAMKTNQNGQSPSLYLHRNWMNGTAVASEAFDESPDWEVFPDHHLLIADDEVAIEAL